MTRHTKPTDLRAPDYFTSAVDTIPTIAATRVTRDEVRAARECIAKHARDEAERAEFERMLGVAR